MASIFCDDLRELSNAQPKVRFCISVISRVRMRVSGEHDFYRVLRGKKVLDKGRGGSPEDLYLWFGVTTCRMVHGLDMNKSPRALIYLIFLWNFWTLSDFLLLK